MRPRSAPSGSCGQGAPAEAFLALRRDDRLDALLARAPLGRVVRQEDVAGAVAAGSGNGRPKAILPRSARAACAAAR